MVYEEQHWIYYCKYYVDRTSRHPRIVKNCLPKIVFYFDLPICRTQLRSIVSNHDELGHVGLAESALWSPVKTIPFEHCQPHHTILRQLRTAGHESGVLGECAR